MKDKGCEDLAIAIENGDYDNTKFSQLTAETFNCIVESLLFASEKVGLDIEA